MELCIAKARESGAAWAGVRNSNHFGMAGYFAMQALPYDYIGLAMTVGGALSTVTCTV
jgi:LDH2 family malate/lactate/ureidoglycolate dehydrogenase